MRCRCMCSARMCAATTSVAFSNSRSLCLFHSKQKQQTLHISPHKHIQHTFMPIHVAEQASGIPRSNNTYAPDHRRTERGGQILSAQRTHTPISILRVPLMCFETMTAAFAFAPFVQATTLRAANDQLCHIYILIRILSNTQFGPIEVIYEKPMPAKSGRIFCVLSIFWYHIVEFWKKNISCGFCSKNRICDIECVRLVSYDICHFME